MLKFGIILCLCLIFGHVIDDNLFLWKRAFFKACYIDNKTNKIWVLYKSYICLIDIAYDLRLIKIIHDISLIDFAYDFRLIKNTCDISLIDFAHDLRLIKNYLGYKSYWLCG